MAACDRGWSRLCPGIACSPEMEEPLCVRAFQMDYEDADYSYFLNPEENATEADPLYAVYIPIIYSITCVTGLLGNMLVIIVFVCYERKKTLTDALFVSLASADILLLCSLPLLAYYSVHSWIFGEVMCKIVRGMYRINLYSSMLTLTAITIDRFISIVKVTKAQRYQQHKHKWGGGLCGLIWLVSLLLAIPQLAFSMSKHEHCFEHYQPELELAILSFQLILGFLTPLLAMMVCYTFIIKTLIHSRSLQKKKSIKIIITLVVVFISTQLPFNVTSLMFVLKPGDISLRKAVPITETIAYMHACLNPILYIFVGTKFRNHFWKMLKTFGLAKRWKEPSRVTEPSTKCGSASTNMEAISLQQR